MTFPELKFAAINRDLCPFHGPAKRCIGAGGELVIEKATQMEDLQ